MTLKEKVEKIKEKLRDKDPAAFANFDNTKILEETETCCVENCSQKACFEVPVRANTKKTSYYDPMTLCQDCFDELMPVAIKSDNCEIPCYIATDQK